MNIEYEKDQPFKIPNKYLKLGFIVIILSIMVHYVNKHYLVIDEETMRLHAHTVFGFLTSICFYGIFTMMRGIHNRQLEAMLKRAKVEFNARNVAQLDPKLKQELKITKATDIVGIWGMFFSMSYLAFIVIYHYFYSNFMPLQYESYIMAGCCGVVASCLISFISNDKNVAKIENFYRIKESR
ncbi:hypothetical protein A7M79_07370 [Acinetobacter baumannii]|uniref:hypothetical protein n=1 Tax=Acinetobacter baumannii TaxID=470 RepID=UPI0008DC72E6|nr:hypothetical protein [Acinetobacter baumannii]OIH08626.1 hypothetical protein A7M79_07370 [Acinetobacter baumannii]